MSLREAENFCGKLRPGETSYFQGQLSLRTLKSKRFDPSPLKVRSLKNAKNH